jgi:S-adenosyl-L-methionine hydrolase (adenosine-forming)
MIIICSDFGVSDPYQGQMQAVLAREAPGIPAITLFPELPAYAVKSSAYLISAYTAEFPPGSVFLCVVDPGVGTNRLAVIVEAEGRWFVGPDNGLFEVIRMRAGTFRQWCIDYRPQNCSDSFHGRDIFAPVAARLARGESVPGVEMAEESIASLRWPEDLLQVVYCDHYGNAMTGLRGIMASQGDRFFIRGHELEYARTFGEVPAGQAFWYINANGLVEFSMNQGDITRSLGLEVGAEFQRIQS